ncbi:MAG: KTSC domain-containing protein [Phycisphaerae bacterium]|nr:KTSC domain-containing protein [Phycisphaerae bacterium]
MRSIKSGRTYLYAGVPERMDQDMIAATSIGSYFSQNIRKTFTNFYVI